MEHSQDTYVYGSALVELAQVVKICLEQQCSSSEAIGIIENCCEMGGTKYPIKWIPLDPRIHYFPSFEMALANAMLWVPPPVKAYLAEERVKFADMLCAISKHISSDGNFHVYAVVVGLNEVFSHSTVGAAVSAAHRESKGDLDDLGF